MSPWGWLFLAHVEIGPDGRLPISAFRWAETIDIWCAGKTNGVRGYLKRLAEMSRG